VYDILCANLAKQRAARATTVAASKQQQQAKHVAHDTATAAASDADDSDINDEDVSGSYHYLVFTNLCGKTVTTIGCAYLCSFNVFRLCVLCAHHSVVD
jgi:hypothetical protein